MVKYISNLSYTSATTKMKIFKIIQKKLMILGINGNETNRFDWKLKIIFWVVGLGILSSIILICSMETIAIMDYVIFFNLTSSLTLMCNFWGDIVYQRIKLFNLITNIEKIVHQSNFFCLHNFIFLLKKKSNISFFEKFQDQNW